MSALIRPRLSWSSLINWTSLKGEKKRCFHVFMTRDMQLLKTEIALKWSADRRHLTFKTPHKAINTVYTSRILCIYSWCWHSFTRSNVYILEAKESLSELVSQAWGTSDTSVAFYFDCNVHWEGEGFWYEYWAGKQERRHPGLKGGELK